MDPQGYSQDLLPTSHSAWRWLSHDRNGAQLGPEKKSLSLSPSRSILFPSAFPKRIHEHQTMISSFAWHFRTGFSSCHDLNATKSQTGNGKDTGEWWNFLKNSGPSTLETTLPGKLLYRYDQVARALDLVRDSCWSIYAVSSLFPEKMP